jgi:Carboxypeptidase regulatory-like domain
MSNEFVRSIRAAFDACRRNYTPDLLASLWTSCLHRIGVGFLGLVASFVSLGIVVAPAAAQLTTGDVLGTITDESGAVIPGAKVTLRNVGTGITQMVQSNEAGDYVFTLLQPGSYSGAN